MIVAVLLETRCLTSQINAVVLWHNSSQFVNGTIIDKTSLLAAVSFLFRVFLAGTRYLELEGNPKSD